MSGYVRIHRALIGHPAFRNDAEAMAFAWMVAKAAWKPVRVRYKERAINLQRGQLAVSQRDMARALDRDKAWIERLWKRLKGEAMVRVDIEAGVAVITICNYSNYQASEDRREAANEAGDEAEARQGRGTEQRREEVKKKEEPKGSTLNRRAIPDDWQPLPFALGTQSRKVVDSWPPGELPAQVEQFKAHHRAKGNTFKDFQDAFSTWVLNTRKFGVGRNDRQSTGSRNQQAFLGSVGNDPYSAF